MASFRLVRDQGFKAMQMFMGKLEAAAAAMVSISQRGCLASVWTDLILVQYLARDCDDGERQLEPREWSIHYDSGKRGTGWWKQNRWYCSRRSRSFGWLGHFVTQPAIAFERGS